MRQVLLGSGTASTSASAGFITLKYIPTSGNDKGKNIAVTGGSSGNASDVKFGTIEVSRANADGGPIVVPFSTHNLTVVDRSYVAAVAMVKTIALSGVTITAGYDYTVVFVKKGLKFNERNKWTFTLRADSSDTTSTLATKIAKFVNDNSELLELTAAVSNNTTVTFTAKNKAIDFVILPTDSLSGLTVTTTTARTLGEADYNEVAELISKANADMGYRDTYDDGDLYPNLGKNPFATAAFTDNGFSIITLTFSEPREMKTMDDAVKQIVQIILPYSAASTKATQYSDLMDILNRLKSY